MGKIRISITEASRTLTDCVKRAHAQNQTLVLLSNGVPLARLVPEKPKICTGRDLAEALCRTELSDSEAAAWHQDLQATRNTQKAPQDKWQ